MRDQRHRLTLAVALVLACWLGAGRAEAGAWPQAKGKLFAAAAHYANSGGHYSGVYLDYGLTGWLGLGLDWGRAVSGREKTVVFLRAPLRRAAEGRGLNIGLQLGLGVIERRDVLRPGVSLGKSLSLAGREGWIAADLFAEIGRDATVDVKADVTLGLALTPSLTGMVQVQTGQTQTDPAFVRLVPSLLWRLRNGAQIEFGVTQELRDGRTTGIKLGLWRSF